MPKLKLDPATETVEDKISALIPPDPDSHTGGEPDDPFAPENLILPQAFDEQMPVKKLLNMVPVRKPGAQDWIRVRPGSEFQQNVAVVDLKSERELFVVTKNVLPYLAGEIVHITLRVAVTRQGVIFLWPIRLPGPDGKDMAWWQTARDAADRATKEWIRVKANMDLGAYDVWTVPSDSPAQLEEPEWPAEGFWQLIKIAFKNSLIDSTDHPVVKKLRGLS